MVVGNFGTIDRKPNVIFDPTEYENRCVAVKTKVDQSEWRVAVETVLPHLLGHNKFPKKSALLYHEDKENIYLKNYFEAICDFGRWISNIGSSFFPWRVNARKMKPRAIPLTAAGMKEFFILLESFNVKSFLEEDKCKIFADSYLLAIVFTYFLRAGFTTSEYNTRNFFIALVLAHEMEEENYAVELLTLELETSAILDERTDFVPIHRLRYELFVRMNYRALVSRKCCEEIMSLYPEHWAWKRKRNECHAGVYQDRRYPSRCFDEYRLMGWKPLHSKFLDECEPCLKEEKLKLAILSKLQERNVGKRLSLKKSKLSLQQMIDAEDTKPMLCPAKRSAV